MRRKKTPDGYRSKAEARFAEVLEENKVPYFYEHHKLEYIVPEQRKKYLPDFFINHKGAYCYIEFKGRFIAADRKKMLLVKQNNETLDIRLVFMQDNKLTKKSKTKYSDWAKKHGFKYHVGISLPQKWIKELSPSNGKSRK